MFKKIGKGVKKFMTKTLVGRVVDEVALGGAIHTTATRTNYTNEGELDGREIILRIMTTSIPVILLLSLIFGWLDLETVKEVAKILIP